MSDQSQVDENKPSNPPGRDIKKIPFSEVLDFLKSLSLGSLWFILGLFFSYSISLVAVGVNYTDSLQFLRRESSSVKKEVTRPTEKPTEPKIDNRSASDFFNDIKDSNEDKKSITSINRKTLPYQDDLGSTFTWKGRVIDVQHGNEEGTALLVMEVLVETNKENAELYTVLPTVPLPASYFRTEEVRCNFSSTNKELIKARKDWRIEVYGLLDVGPSLSECTLISTDKNNAEMDNLMRIPIN